MATKRKSIEAAIAAAPGLASWAPAATLPKLMAQKVKKAKKVKPKKIKKK